MTLHDASVRAGLRARTTRLDRDVELLDHLGRDGFAWLDGTHGFVTDGVAAVVEPDAVAESLAAIADERTADAPAVGGPRAVGALPFDGNGRLVIPSRIVGRDADGDTWLTVIDDASPGPVHRPVRVPGRYAIRTRTGRDDWRRAVDDASRAIAEGAIDKVVLARAVDVDADSPFDRRHLLDLLRGSQPGCIVYADGDFVGASPELLVRRTGACVICRPLAGTASTPAALLSSDKDAREHRLVVDAVVGVLASRCDDVVAVGPAPIGLADLAHLATEITATLRDPGMSALDLGRALHPTPAVCGTPTAVARELIRRLEPDARDRYAGPCGWVDAQGDGEFVVALRCASIDGSRARLHAGAGIVAGSDPDAEWAETQAKLEPMLRVLVRP